MTGDAVREVLGRPAALDACPNVRPVSDQTSDRRCGERPLELVAEQRLERRSAVGALAGAALSPMDSQSRDRDGVVRKLARHPVAVLPMSGAGDEHGFDLESEAKREHVRKVAPPRCREQDRRLLLGG